MSNLEAFRAETRAWLEANAPASLRGTRAGRFDGYWGGSKATDVGPDVMRWFERSLERGWTAPTWPTEYGGGGLSRAEATVLDQELTRLELPPPLVGFGLVMIGPILLEYGTLEQKQRHLPGIIEGRVRWCQGYSEPGAGSDLASLSCKAELHADHFVLNGQKVWTSYANQADWIFCLVRTDTSVKKQAGITFILVDMAAPGVTVRPILLISGASPFCETFLEDVRVPVGNVISEVNAGWTVAKALLQHERATIGQAVGAQLTGAEQDLARLAREHVGAAPDGTVADPFVRRDIAEYGMAEEAFQLTIARIAQQARSGGAPGLESSILKVVGSDMKQWRWELATRIAGPQGLGWEGPGFDAAEIDMTRQWLRSRGNTIEGGTNEIQLNIIAKRVLGLPS